MANEFVMLIAITAEILAGKNESNALVMLPSFPGSSAKLPFHNNDLTFFNFTSNKSGNEKYSPSLPKTKKLELETEQ